MSQYFPLDGPVVRDLLLEHNNSFTFTFMFVEEIKSKLYFHSLRLLLFSSVL